MRDFFFALKSFDKFPFIISNKWLLFWSESLPLSLIYFVVKLADGDWWRLAQENGQNGAWECRKDRRWWDRKIGFGFSEGISKAIDSWTQEFFSCRHQWNEKRYQKNSKKDWKIGPVFLFFEKIVYFFVRIWYENITRNGRSLGEKKRVRLS